MGYHIGWFNFFIKVIKTEGWMVRWTCKALRSENESVNARSWKLFVIWQLLRFVWVWTFHHQRPIRIREFGLSDFVPNCNELHSKVFSLRHSQPQDGAAQSSDSFSNHSCMWSRWPPWPHERQIMAWPFTKRPHQTHLKQSRNILCIQAVLSVLPHLLFFSVTFCPGDLNPGLTFLGNTVVPGFRALGPSTA